MRADTVIRDISEIAGKLEPLGEVRLHAPMKDYTTFRTGGPADLLVYPRDPGALKEIVLLARGKNIPLTVIGGGSNLLVGDRGIRGIVVRLSEDGVREGVMRIEDGNTVYADGIKKKKDFTRFCVDNGLSGVEFMAGIPGCVGGGIVMNAGTTMGNFADILDRVLFVDADGRLGIKKVTGAMAGYRRMDIGEGAIVWGGYFRLPRAEDPDAVRARIEEIMEERGRKHPLSYPSAGSVFKNPEGRSSWKLIDDAGLKGKRIGGAMVSELHTNFIVNVDNATSRDILELIDLVRERVGCLFHADLEPEIKMLGEF